MAARMVVRLEHRVVESPDGTRLSYHLGAVAGPTSGTIVLAADLGDAVPDVWRPQIDCLGRRRRILAWDYRGTGSSSAPPRRRYDVAAHLEDLCAVVDAAVGGAASFSVVGAGVGVRVALEAALAMPQRVESVALIGGAAGWRYDALCGVGSGRLFDLAQRRLGLRLPEGVAYADTLTALGTLPVIGRAHRLCVPALVLAGQHDPLMPAALVHQLARRLPRSEVAVIRGAGRRLTAELPDLVNLRLERFFA